VNKQEKVDLINTLSAKVIDHDADGETCYYVHVPVDDETRAVLNKLGKDDSWINANAGEIAGERFIDIAPVGFDYAT